MKNKIYLGPDFVEYKKKQKKFQDPIFQREALLKNDSPEISENFRLLDLSAKNLLSIVAGFTWLFSMSSGISEEIGNNGWLHRWLKF